MTTSINRCEDCKHSEKPYKTSTAGHWAYAACLHPMFTPVSTKYSTSFCSNQRKYDSADCGPKGKLFEPIEKPVNKRKWWKISLTVEK